MAHPDVSLADDVEAALIGGRSESSLDDDDASGVTNNNGTQADMGCCDGEAQTEVSFDPTVPVLTVVCCPVNAQFAGGLETRSS